MIKVNRDEIACPYCGFTHEADEEAYESSNFYWECDHCKETFMVSSVTLFVSTQLTEEEVMRWKIEEEKEGQ